MGWYTCAFVSKLERKNRHYRARAQLSLVEAALCPLDTAVSMQPNFRFDTRYFFTDSNRNRRRANVTVGALNGMSPHDDLYLWGLLSLALSQTEPTADFYATPYYCLRRLGMISSTKRGGREFEMFRETLRRLGGIRYQCSAFYDPVRGEHRDVAFGFLNYSLPLGTDSSRAWRFAWDPIFFELAQATGGALSFDLSLYRDMGAASRRLYLWLKKVLWRNDPSPRVEIRHLAVDVLGFSEESETWRLKQKLTRCIHELADLGIVDLPKPPTELYEKAFAGTYSVRLHRGPRFNERSKCEQESIQDSPVFDVLQSLNFEPTEIRSLLRKYPARTLERWADITLAARERHGDGFFKASPKAYFVDNVKAAVTSGRTEPDWWRDMRKQQLQQERDQEIAKRTVLQNSELDGFDEYVQDEAREVFETVTRRFVDSFKKQGQAESVAEANAKEMARKHLQNRFRNENSQRSSDGPTSIGDILGFPAD